MDYKLMDEEALAICEAYMRKPHAAKGRQNDIGAQLKPAGVLVVPVYTDPSVPGEVYVADLASMKADLFCVRPVVQITGEDDRPSMPVVGASIFGNGPSGVLGKLLKGKLLPGLVGKLIPALFALLLFFVGRCDAADVWYGPGALTTPVIVARIQAARSAIYVQAGAFSSTAIARALLAARERGVEVHGLLDPAARPGRMALAYARSHGVRLLFDPHAAGETWMVVDDQALVGTVKYQDDAPAGALTSARAPAITSALLASWRAHAEHAVP